MKTINIYYFDNFLGEFDIFNPRYVMEQKYTKQIISILSTECGFYFNPKSLSKKMNISLSNLTNAFNLLYNISAIKSESGYLALNFPFFTSSDIKILKKIVNGILKDNEEKLRNFICDLSSRFNEIYPTIDPKISLYHLLCGKIFDGLMFDFLEQSELLKQSYPQNNNRDYIIIGYQNSLRCNRFNAELFCSVNSAKYKDDSLTSFGNAHGERLDYFRYFKLREKNNIHDKFRTIHNYFSNETQESIIKNSIQVIKDILMNKVIEDNKYLKILQYCQYIGKNKKIIVPIFMDYKNKLNIIFNFLVSNYGDFFKKLLEDFKLLVLSSNMSCLNHSVPIDQLCNELWHIFFGILTKFLIKNKFIAKPKNNLWQGSYLKCIYLEYNIESK